MRIPLLFKATISLPLAMRLKTMRTDIRIQMGIIWATIKGILSAKKNIIFENGMPASIKSSTLSKKSTARYIPTTNARTIPKYFEI
jgi:hypothetical protein